MKSLKSIIFTAGILIALPIFNLQAEVQIYNQPPSAEEMGRVLFGQEQGVVNERSINFGKSSAPAPQKSSVRKSTAASENNATSELTSVGLPIEFAYNSDKILDDSMPFLEEVGKMLKLDEYANKNLVIEGHTDAVGSETYNLALSQRRAKAVKQYLIQHFKISAARLKARGMGESKPLPGYAPEDEANRRVQFYSGN